MTSLYESQDRVDMQNQKWTPLVKMEFKTLSSIPDVDFRCDLKADPRRWVGKRQWLTILSVQCDQNREATGNDQAVQTAKGQLVIARYWEVDPCVDIAAGAEQAKIARRVYRYRRINGGTKWLLSQNGGRKIADSQKRMFRIDPRHTRWSSLLLAQTFKCWLHDIDTLNRLKV